MDAIRLKLHETRRELLDLTARNRLLNTPITRKRSSRLDIVGEDPDFVYEALVVQGRTFSFKPGPVTFENIIDDTPAADPAQLSPEPEAPPAPAATEKHDRYLQTELGPEELPKRLLSLYRDANSFEEELGINILYLALGFLLWTEAEHAETPRYAPLVLVPVKLERLAADRFRLSYNGEDLTPNISLQERLRLDFAIELPGFPDAPEDLRPSAYFEAVAEAVAPRAGWQVLRDRIVLWFFSFSKLLMYLDLAPENWPQDYKLEEHPLISGLLHTGFRPDPPLCEEDAQLDELLDPRELLHVLDADSSQALVIEEVKRGRNLVVQGPPGTGKSQTIANIIASAVASGKRVLFVAEKRAALEVVKRRLDRIGLGDLCLELHSHKANKRAVLEEIRRTLQLGPPVVEDVDSVVTELKALRDRLNRHVACMHTPISPSDVSPYEAASWLVRLQVNRIPAPEFELPESATWDRATFRQKEMLLHDVLNQLPSVGVPRQHPWRGVRLTTVLPPDLERIVRQARSVHSDLDALLDEASQLGELLQIPPPLTFAGVDEAIRVARLLARAPHGGVPLVTGEVWRTSEARIRRLVELGLEWSQIRKELQGVVAESAWNTDLTQVRRDLAETGRSWIRWLLPRYRRAMAVLREILLTPPPRKLEERLALVDKIRKAQQLEDQLTRDELARIGEAAFGPLWDGLHSPWEDLASLLRWFEQLRQAAGHADWQTYLRSAAPPQEMELCANKLARRAEQTRRDLARLCEQLQLNLAEAFGEHDLSTVPLDTVLKRLEQWIDSPQDLQYWILYRHRVQALSDAGLETVAKLIDDGTVVPEYALDQLRYAWCIALLRVAFSRHPDLSRFNGLTHDQLIERFQQLDARRIEIARQQVARLHYDNLPRGGQAGEMAILYRELAKKRRHIPLRTLFAEAGRAIQQIKPVFMMSPLSVAQFLAPGRISFDLIIMDEASQIRPVDALGAIARARQLVVVGDDRQLPPTTFFDRLVASDGSDSDPTEIETRDMESILDLCCAQNMSQRMLRWHYRSRHHSLIAVSNRLFYDNRLWVVPSPTVQAPDLGLRFHYVPDGVFDRGGTARNPREATVVVEAILDHARRWPDKSLGVGTFSVSQRDEILEQLDERLREHPELEPFFSPNREEPFFVKNLENIQGDERDVIFISVGYGPDESGFISMNFGPLNHQGGERRLNVLITRARERCEVFASLTADDIDINRTQAAGVRALKTFLHFASTGQLDESQRESREETEPASPFEMTLAEVLRSKGHEADTSIGMAGIFVDVGVRVPDRPERYVLGINTDGIHYARPRWARDRDRIQPAVLAARGWKLKRAWVLDAVRHPDSIVEDILDAVASCAHAENSSSDPAPSVTSTVERETRNDDAERGPVERSAYVVATPELVGEDVVTSGDIESIVRRVIEIEGPIHREEVVRRVARLLDKERAGTALRQAVLRAVRSGLNNGTYVQDGPFLQLAGKHEAPVRDRSSIDIRTLRNPDFLPGAEIKAALTAVVEANVGVRRDEAAVQVARLLGFRVTPPALRRRIDAEIDRLLEAGILKEERGRLYTGNQPSTGPS